MRNARANSGRRRPDGAQFIRTLCLFEAKYRIAGWIETGYTALIKKRRLFSLLCYPMLLATGLLPARAFAQQLDGIGTLHPIEVGTITEFIGDDISRVDVVIIGEGPHYSAEIPGALVSVVIPDLYENGFRLFLNEDNHALGWVFDFYVRGQLRDSDLPRDVFSPSRALYDSIRRFNLNREDPIRLGSIDVNHFPWAFRTSIALASQFIDLDGILDPAIDSQFGGSPGPNPCATEGAPCYAERQMQLIYLERRYAQEYQHRLEEALSVLAGQEHLYRSMWGDRWYDRVRDLTSVELLSSRYRASQNMAGRESIMYANTLDALENANARALLYVGLVHAERAKSSMSNRWQFPMLGERLSEAFQTYHIMAYGLAGERLRHFSSSVRIFFDECAPLPSDNLVTILCDLCDTRSLLVLDPSMNDTRRWFGDSPVFLGRSWDALMIFPEVSIHSDWR